MPGASLRCEGNCVSLTFLCAKLLYKVVGNSGEEGIRSENSK